MVRIQGNTHIATWQKGKYIVYFRRINQTVLQLIPEIVTFWNQLPSRMWLQCKHFYRAITNFKSFSKTFHTIIMWSRLIFESIRFTDFHHFFRSMNRLKGMRTECGCVRHIALSFYRVQNRKYDVPNEIQKRHHRPSSPSNGNMTLCMSASLLSHLVVSGHGTGLL